MSNNFSQRLELERASQYNTGSSRFNTGGSTVGYNTPNSFNSRPPPSIPRPAGVPRSSGPGQYGNQQSKYNQPSHDGKWNASNYSQYRKYWVQYNSTQQNSDRDHWDESKLNTRILYNFYSSFFFVRFRRKILWFFFVKMSMFRTPVIIVFCLLDNFDWKLPWLFLI